MLQARLEAAARYEQTLLKSLPYDEYQGKVQPIRRR
jgi:hypothetical protein